jgi:hypothetical protein
MNNYELTVAAKEQGVFDSRTLVRAIDSALVQKWAKIEILLHWHLWSVV